MRALIKRLGIAVYDNAARRCRRFEAWCRHYILYFHLPRRKGPSALKLIRHDQLSALESAAQEAVTERSRVSVSKQELHHQAELALAELRLHRHPTTPMELLRNPQQAKEFMFTFVSKRINLLPLKPRWMTLCERQAENGEKLKAALVIEDEVCGSVEVTSGKMPATPRSNPVIAAKAISEEDVQKAVTSWIWTNVNPGFWQDVAEEVSTQVYKLGRIPSKKVATGSLREIIAAHRPTHTPHMYPELISGLVDWLLDWTMNLTRNPHLAFDAIRKGFVQAWRESGKIA
jgi:hypothetical protein